MANTIQVDHLPHNLAQNLTAMRRQRQLSQAQLASAADIPRSTITHMESGAGNPSLTNLARVAAALQVSIEELLARPRDAVSLTAADALSVRERGGGKVRVTKLLPESIAGLAIDRLEFAPAGAMRGTPHIRGTREYLYVLDGSVTVLVSGEIAQVAAGCVLAFPGDLPHSYRHGAGRKATAISVVLPVPAGQ